MAKKTGKVWAPSSRIRSSLRTTRASSPRTRSRCTSRVSHRSTSSPSRRRRALPWRRAGAIRLSGFSARGSTATTSPTRSRQGSSLVTTCTDLLRAGGYARLPKYLEGAQRHGWTPRRRSDGHRRVHHGNPPTRAVKSKADPAIRRALQPRRLCEERVLDDPRYAGARRTAKSPDASGRRSRSSIASAATSASRFAPTMPTSGSRARPQHSLLQTSSCKKAESRRPPQTRTP